MLEPGHLLELVYLSKPDWTADDQNVAGKLREDFGLFRNPERKVAHEEGCPNDTQE